ncbi:hypothetical protein [Vibrio sp. SCSIO 43136]|uniref:hypothetical protein n=1 Tax=Vibrio sp. SCSIO 43136 TaxID=2819101 RepID=UPI0020758B02|nr:hypothetical protein [Vibrio sp. SCSIO 43136]USD66857.1 hypothetical protein J4N39_19590 [Vibrio sp. SCSIO 43136]
MERSFGNLAEQTKCFPSYVNPSAYCPVCGASVFFYQSPYGGRVFFDSLGKPWEKHPCTDNRNLPVKTISQTEPSGTRIGKFKSGEYNPFVVASITKFHITSRVKIIGLLNNDELTIALSNVTRVEFGDLNIDVNSPCMAYRKGKSIRLSFVNHLGGVVELSGDIQD